MDKEDKQTNKTSYLLGKLRCSSLGTLGTCVQHMPKATPEVEGLRSLVEGFSKWVHLLWAEPETALANCRGWAQWLCHPNQLLLILVDVGSIHSSSSSGQKPRVILIPP